MLDNLTSLLYPKLPSRLVGQEIRRSWLHTDVRLPPQSGWNRPSLPEVGRTQTIRESQGYGHPTGPSINNFRASALRVGGEGS